jgi:hypothetical protein
MLGASEIILLQFGGLLGAFANSIAELLLFVVKDFPQYANAKEKIMTSAKTNFPTSIIYMWLFIKIFPLDYH